MLQQLTAVQVGLLFAVLPSFVLPAASAIHHRLTSLAPRPPQLIPHPPLHPPQRELHELAGGHGPEFDLQEHLPQPAGLAQHAAASQQQRRRRQEQPGEQGEAGGGATQEPVPMAE